MAAWVLFDPAAQPFYTLITTFIFAPFFAARLAENAAIGQTLWAFAATAAGIVIALLSPLFGAIADAGGRRKPWIAAFSVLAVLGMTLLWWAVPGTATAVPMALAGYFIAALGVEFATVFNNAMMPSLVPPERVGRLSGLGWAAGYAGGLVALVIAVAFMAASPETGRTILGLAPILGLDPASGGGDRATGPFSAIWYALLVLPLFVFVPDGERRASLPVAARRGLAELRAQIAGLGREQNFLRYLVAHMIYADGLAGLFIFGGVYAAGVFGWTTIELGLFGIMLAITGAIGAYAGGVLDDRLGPKRVIAAALILLIAASIAILTLSPEAAPKAGLFATTPERIYIGLGILIGISAGPLQAASRTLLVRLSDPARITQSFGLYALTGKLTSFAAPLAVGVVTGTSGSQRSGMAVLIAFFLTGLLVLLAVRPQRAA